MLTSIITSRCVLRLPLWRPTPITRVQGSVPVPAFDRPVLLIGRGHMNRAVQGDVVAVEVFDEKDWKAPGDEVVDQESASRSQRFVIRDPLTFE